MTNLEHSARILGNRSRLPVMQNNRPAKVIAGLLVEDPCAEEPACLKRRHQFGHFPLG